MALTAGAYGVEAANAATYPDPGAVTGSTGAHDPSITKTPSGGYLLAATGDGIALKTSTDRTRFSGG
jgi:arabinan endo-1,5-alpha-L-arabinosidase